MTPACRIPPPNNFRTRRASAINSFDPARAEPIGIPPSFRLFRACAIATFTWDQDDWEVLDAVKRPEWTFDSPR